ncbi:MAG TPA: DUF3769 domain-containing protein [Nodosilinea sp.]|nr:DUF3769 domain-containing protein [Nodosilinea sp.]
MPPAPEMADVALVSAADLSAAEGRQLAVGKVEEVGEAAIAPLPAMPYSAAHLLLPLAQAAPSPSAPLVPPAPANSPDAEAAPPDSLTPAPPLPAPLEASPPAAAESQPLAPAADPAAPVETSPPQPSPETPLEPIPETPAGPGEVLLRANQQVVEPIRQIVSATGDVLLQFGTGQLAADRLWVNLKNRHVRAEGNVFFNRNNQTIEGDTATYNLLQGAGTMLNARGELQLSTLDDDFSSPTAGNTPSSGAPLDYRLQTQRSISQVTSPGGLAISTGPTDTLLAGQQQGLRRLRFESARLDFDADGWYADQLRLTNDPFSPPELEFRANNVRLTPLNAEEDELVFDNPRLVLNQWISIPLVRRRYILNRGQLPPDAFNPFPTNIGIDGRDRGGLFLEREFSLTGSNPWNVSVAPQFLVSRWLGSSNYNIADPANFGIAVRVNGPLSPRTSATGIFNLSGLDLENFSENLRANFRAQQLVGTHRLNLEYVYRDRLFNGSLGFQDVQSSMGLLLESPVITLGGSGINLTYQVSGQYVTANTDRPELLSPGVGIGLTNQFRFQGSADLSRFFSLWQGQPLPATPTEGLRYSPRPVVPSLGLGVGLRGVATYYTSDDLQESLDGRIFLVGQLGRLQSNFFDYTQFNIGYSRSFIGGDSSPFLFDRTVDQSVLSGGVLQQIYGPFLAGFQTQINLDTGRTIDTNLVFEYRRRAYGLQFSYNLNQETGFLGFRISDFDWVGRTAPFDADPSTPSDVVVQ